MMVEVGPSVNSECTCDDLDVDFDVNLKVQVCWWSNLDVCQLGRGVDRTNVIGVVESWLRGDEDVSFEGYKCFGNNRKSTHK